jgi:hypothetical protein
VVNGSNDVIIDTVNSLILQQNLPNAQVILYPDGNHGVQPDPSLCGTVELELIWRKRKVPSYNNVGKLTPPRRRLNLVHESEPPNFKWSRGWQRR